MADSVKKAETSLDEDEEAFRRTQAAAGTSVRAGTGAPASKVKPPSRDRFVKVPLWWAEQLTQATDSAGEVFVGLWLLYLAWKTKVG